MRTTTHGSFGHALAANMRQRASSGVGIIATPFFPYSNTSVWNRNQLGGLGGLDLTTLLIAGVAGYLLLANRRKLGF